VGALAAPWWVDYREHLLSALSGSERSLRLKRFPWAAPNLGPTKGTAFLFFFSFQFRSLKMFKYKKVQKPKKFELKNVNIKKCLNLKKFIIQKSLN
jgi:hypothetical protein